MEQIVCLTRGGDQWVPEFVTDLNQDTCIGCGRCYKVCPRDVFELVERGGDSDDDDDEFSDEPTMVMAINNPMDCIGCMSCSRVCPKNCHTHQTQAALG